MQQVKAMAFNLIDDKLTVTQTYQHCVASAKKYVRDIKLEDVLEKFIAAKHHVCEMNEKFETLIHCNSVAEIKVRMGLEGPAAPDRLIDLLSKDTQRMFEETTDEKAKSIQSEAIMFKDNFGVNLELDSGALPEIKQSSGPASPSQDHAGIILTGDEDALEEQKQRDIFDSSSEIKAGDDDSGSKDHLKPIAIVTNDDDKASQHSVEHELHEEL